MLAYLSGCGVWTNNNDFFNRHFTPGSEGPDEPFVRGPLMEAFLRFWTFIIILQVCKKYFIDLSFSGPVSTQNEMRFQASV